MSRHDDRFRCRVDGCSSSWRADGESRRAHEATEHARCCCGWVGVSFTKHVAQRLRQGHPRVEHRVTATLRSPST